MSVIVNGPSNAAAAYGVNSAFNANSLTPDALMIYLQDRLSGLDTQVQSIFAKQQHNDKVREVCGKLNTLMAGLKEDGGRLSDDQKLQFESALAEYEQLDPQGAAQLRSELMDGGILKPDLAPDFKLPTTFLGKAAETVEKRLEDNWLKANDGKYSKQEFKKTQELLEHKMSTLEANSQLNMIKLQSLMSNRQTAIQLSTNLISSLGESQKAIASNIGR
jgi:hypothetical protein